MVMPRVAARFGLVSHRWPFTGRDEELQAFSRVLSDGDYQAFVIHGAAGVGKSRLAEECLSLARVRGHRCGRAVTNAAAGVPLGALAHLLPEAFDASDPAPAFRSARDALERGAGREGKRHVLLVDDLNLLDETSATLIGQLLAAQSVFLVATVRSGDRLDQSASGLQSGDAALRVDLLDLSREKTEQLLTAVLQAPVEPRSVSLLFDGSQGNMLFLRELILGALQSGTLLHDGEMWQLTGPLAGTHLLGDLLRKRKENVSRAAHEVLELLALCQPVGVGEVPEAAVDELAAAGLVDMTLQERRQQLTLTHPMYGEIVQSGISGWRRRNLLLEQAQRTRAHGARRREDVLRIASWELTATGQAEPQFLLRGAKLARYAHDFPQVRELASAACWVDEGCWPRLLLGEALYELGELEEAEKVLQQAADRARGEEEHILVAMQRIRNMLWGLERPEEALEITTEAAEKVTSAEGRAVLAAERGNILCTSGKVREALDVLEGLEGAADHPNLRGPSQFAHAYALIANGRVEEGLQSAQTGYAQRLRLSESAALPHPSQYITAITFGLQEAGRLEEAFALGQQSWEDASADRILVGQTWNATALSRVALMQGRPATARRWAAQGAALARQYSFNGPLFLALARLAEAVALLGDVEAAQRALDEAKGLRPWSSFAAEEERAEAWLAAAQGDIPLALSILAQGATVARESSLTSEACVLMDQVRLGDAPAVADRLAEIAGIGDGKLTDARAQYATACVNDNPEQLQDCTRRFSSYGTNLLAAEAATATALAWQRRGFPREAAAARSRAADLAAQCEGARTPGLVDAFTVTPLTRREKEIALLVAEGLPSAKVAERLMISKRTVDNHLQSIYRKLGVTGRRALKDTLQTPESPRIHATSKSPQPGIR
ncbi:LuxR C-terminal-related transcriptional regulator [Streptomyces sp. NPDC051776]|uniref:LuxR C-terminal-related transcriptional regulator n=1 Tax=Streptomyces sp. NPDC051776 TaxID=3155414 RepID=UPI003428A4E7